MGFFDCQSGRDAHTPELLLFEKKSCGWKEVVCHADGLKFIYADVVAGRQERGRLAR